MGYPNWNGLVKYELWQNFSIEKKLTNDKSEDSSYKMHSVSKQNKNAKKIFDCKYKWLHNFMDTV